MSPEGLPTDAVTSLYVKGAYKFKDGRPKGSDPTSTLSTCVTYRVSVKYPAPSLTSFYAEKLKALGFVPYKDSKWSGGKMEWKNFMDTGLRGMPCTYEYLADWVDQGKTRVAMLSIRYLMESDGVAKDCWDHPDNDVAFVTVWSEPYANRIK